MGFSYQFSDVDALCRDECIDRNMDTMLSDANRSDPEIMKLAGHLEGRGPKLVQIPEVQGEVEIENGSMQLQQGVNSNHRSDIAGSHSTKYVYICMHEHTIRGGITRKRCTSRLSTTCWPSTATTDDVIDIEADDNGDRDNRQ